MQILLELEELDTAGGITPGFERELLTSSGSWKVVFIFLKFRRLINLR